MQNKTIGVIISNLQPVIHKGYVQLIKKALTENDEVVILISDADKHNYTTMPFTIDLRQKMIKDIIVSYFSTDAEHITISKLSNFPIMDSDSLNDTEAYIYYNIVNITGQKTFKLYCDENIVKNPNPELKKYMQINHVKFNNLISPIHINKSLVCYTEDDRKYLKTVIPEIILEKYLITMRRILMTEVFLVV